LLRASFMPERPLRELRDLTRHRSDDSATPPILHQ